MGYDITAYGTNEDLEEITDEYGDLILDFDSVKEISYHRAYMGGFRMMAQQGYNWFDLINASECDDGVSGNGTTKKIKLLDLKNALKILLEHKPTTLASDGFSNERNRDEFSDRKPLLKEFMEKCIKWCEENKKGEILIYFG